MSVILSHKSALKALLRDRSSASDMRHCLPVDANASTDELLAAKRLFSLGNQPMNVLMTSKDPRCIDPQLAQIRSAKALGEIPAFIKIGNVYVASPELCYVQIAATLPPIEAILFAYYMCGDYRPSDIRRKTGNQPLTSAPRLTAFIDALPQVRGKRRAQRAIRYVVDNSNSPQESRLTCIIILPTRAGGFGLIRPQLNQPIPGTSKIGDLCWLDQRLILEYDSRSNHALSEQLDNDSIRRAKIELANYHVISVAPKQLSSLKYLNELGSLTAKMLGANFRHRSPQFQQKQAQLHRQLFMSSSIGF